MSDFYGCAGSVESEKETAHSDIPDTTAIFEYSAKDVYAFCVDEDGSLYTCEMTDGASPNTISVWNTSGENTDKLELNVGNSTNLYCSDNVLYGFDRANLQIFSYNIKSGSLETISQADAVNVKGGYGSR